MEFNAPAGRNLFDASKVVGKSTPRIDGPLKTTGQAPYAYERHDVAANQAYGYIVGSAIAKGRISAMDAEAARAAPGVIAVILATETKPVGKGMSNNAPLFGGSDIAHYHQAIACVVAETFEQARSAAALIRTSYDRSAGRFDFPKLAPDAPLAKDEEGKPDRQTVGDFDSAFAAAEVKIDATYTTPDESHAMMEPHATIAAWDGDKLTLWTSNQMINWGKESMGKILGMDPKNIRLDSPLYWRWIWGKAVYPGRCRRRRPGCKTGKAARQDRVAAAIDGEQYNPPPRNHTAPAHRCRSRRPYHRPRPRKLVGKYQWQGRRKRNAPDSCPVRRCQPPDCQLYCDPRFTRG